VYGNYANSALGISIAIFAFWLMLYEE